MMHERHNALCPQQWLQAFVVDDSEATTDEEDTAPSTSAAQASQEIPEGASSTEAERHAVLERLQGQDNPLAAGFKVRHGPLDPLLVTCWQACFGALTPAYHVPGRLTHSENILRQGSNCKRTAVVCVSYSCLLLQILDRQIDTVLGGAAGLAGSLFGRAHTAGRQVAGKVCLS